MSLMKHGGVTWDSGTGLSENEQREKATDYSNVEEDDSGVVAHFSLSISAFSRNTNGIWRRDMATLKGCCRCIIFFVRWRCFIYLLWQ
jgi:hypothetical protein